MRVALLNPATTRQSPYPHLGLAFLAAQLTNHGHVVICRDGSAPYGPGSNEGLVRRCRDFKPDIIGVTATTECVKFAYHLLYLLRNDLGSIPVVAGGPHVSICPVEMVAHGFDAAVAGAAETRINDLVNLLIAGDHQGLIGLGGVACRLPDRSIRYIPLGQSSTPFDINSLYPVRFMG
ncbi:MAG: cobalamin-dependent protein, partial [Candidatus Edwardsbacteria bacterium]|nr:cobalamin-dependent protein [Candidatus Edwardsbacteria bacterium]